MNLRYYLPALERLYGNSGLDWATYDAVYNNLHEKRNKDGKEGLLVEANIYDIILTLKKEEGLGFWLIDYFNQILDKLNLQLDEIGRTKIKEALHNVFTAHDHKYLNFVGELSVLNQLLSSTVFTLNDVEVPIPNGKSIDFEMLTQSKQPMLVEVHNIHLDDDKVESNGDALLRFLVKRRKDKIAEKRKDLSGEMDFQLVQVLWGNARSLYLYSQLFKNHKELLTNIEPLAYLTLSDPHNPQKFEHKFGRVSSLFEGNIDTSFMN